MAVIYKGNDAKQEALKSVFDNFSKADYEMTAIELHQERLRELASLNITYSPKVADLLRREYAALQEQKRQVIQRQAENKKCILRLIALLPRDTMQDVFRLRYIDRLKWDDIAEKTCYSIGYVQRLHKKALDYLAGQTDNIS